MILVSIIIPVHNMQEYIKKCIDSILEQTLNEIEVICIDDGSIDRSPEILDEIKKSDPRVVVIHQENRGAGMARNRGIEVARGKYLAFMDSDDYYPDKQILKDLVNAAENNSVQIAGGSFSEDHNGKIKYSFSPEFQDYVFKEDRIMEYKEYQFDFGYQRFIYSKNLIMDKNIRFPYYSRFQDPPFFVQAMISAKRFYALKRVSYCYRWGHKVIDWNVKRTNDMVRGVLDNIILSKDEGLEKLHKISVSRIEISGLEAICKNLNINNLELLELLMKANKSIELSFLKEGNCTKDYYVLEPLKRLIGEEYNDSRYNIMCELEQKCKEVEHIKNSISYRLGRIITAPLRYLRRKIRGMFRYTGGVLKGI